MQLDYDSKIQDLDHIIEDKEDYIKELLRQLKQQTEHCIVEPIPRPPGVARRTATIGVQTEPRTKQTHEEQSSFTVAAAKEDSLEKVSFNQFLFDALDLLCNRRHCNSRNCANLRRSWQRR